ncbi:AAA family ATPase [Roseofilum sp. BLCC_M91]|uniref:histidine kinase n=1 Tax=Roseofilum halophilum BLCC-M91 TaxID=3022259 RepID=A0ABT7BMA0_9CYAN|nr:ATP-binding sensor histidine kinase [Roseofilum halophilum]MDJ1180316.1 AAA family ATPase [Roseofilum halophilum BLCC-M91]
MPLKLPGYQIKEKIYQGERTLVYCGLRDADSLNVVIKILRNEYPSFSELLQFYNQYTIAKNLNSNSIVVPLSLERYGNGYALVMENLGAISLDKIIHNHDALDLGNCLQIAIQLADILQELDRNRVIHKDIKPANILIQPDTQEIKLIDFSIATLLPREAQEIKNFNVLEGTLAYISPEQTGRMNRGIDYRSDFYSLGVTLYQLLTGALPFSSTDPMELVHCHISQQPVPPSARNSTIPPMVSDIVMKLMAKNAEDRYQSALGLKFDLETCWQQWQETKKIEPFELATRDIAGRFLIPEKLYGRETEIQTLLTAFERVAEGNTEMMLVAGFSGIGKTAVINEVHKPIVRQRGYFIKGKFDQFNRNIPFSAFVSAFRDLMQQLLGESDAQLAQWKEKILAALGENGQVIIDVIQELESIIGTQPPVPELSGNGAQNRFNLLFQKFIQVFTTQENPLVIFVDDLQWADSASLKLMQLLMSENKTGYLLLLGAYRDNEVSPAHPLMLTLEEMGKLGAKINTITLAPLSETDLNLWVADTLSCTQELAWSLSELINQKTKGNPFFTTQFLKGLHKEGWITFDRDLGYWHCDLTQVRQLSLTDDVVEFMATRLHKLPENTQESLKLAACIGNQFDLQTLAIVSQQSQTEVAAALWKALQEGLVLPLGQTYKFFQDPPKSPLSRGTKDEENVRTEEISVGYKFVHDRVQQAAYSLIPEDQRQITHYHIGQLLLEQTPPELREERIFELVGQLNYGTALITKQQERNELAQLNLVACRKARAATAYQAGRDYAQTGLSLLGEHPWQRHYPISLEFHEIAAELASLCGDFEEMEQFVETAIAQGRSLLEKVNVYRTRIQANISQNQLTEAIAIALQLLQQLGTPLPTQPTEEDIQQAIAEIGQLLGDREIEDLINLPEMKDREKMAIVQIANSIIPVAYIAVPPLFPILICLSVKLSIQYGNTLASGFGYVCYGTIAGNLLKDVSAGVKFGHLALDVVSKLDAKAIKPEVTNAAGLFILHRQSHIKNVLALLQESYRSALEVGNQELAGYCAQNVCLNSFWCSQSLAALEQQTRVYCQGLMQLNQVTTANYCRIYWQSILNLQGLGECPSILSGKALVEAEFLPVLTAAHDWFGLYLFHLYKLMLAYFFGEIELAQEQAVTTRQYLIAGVGMVSEPAFYFYDALSVLADSTGEPEALERVEQNQTQLQEQWARHAPMNHQHKVDLIAAEKARVLGNKAEAIALYDRAIAGAKENEFLQEEALANELAAKFYLDWGKKTVASSYMTDAYYAYARWGAKAKTDQLERQYPQLLSAIVQPFDRLQLISGQTVASKLTRTVSSSSSSTGLMLDWATAMKAAQSLSSEIHLDKLISSLMKAAMENAGADRAILLLSQQDTWQVVARYALQMGQLHSMPTEDDIALPTSVMNKVKRSQQPTIVNDVSREPQLAGDSYLLQEPPKSLLCYPILNQGNPIGILYLENHVAVGAFTTDRIELLNLLCSQAAISLENARLYEQSQDYAQKLEASLKELKQAQLQLVQSEKMSALGNLVAGVAHEINNPVAFIAGNINPAREYLEDLFGLIDLYQEEYPEPTEAIAEEIEAIDLEFLREDLPNLISSMREGTNRIGHISDSLRTFSRVDKDYKVPFNLHHGIDSTLLILKHRLKANEQRPGIEIVKDYGELPEVESFPGQINQVFMNLIANAIDALDETNQGRSFDEITENPNLIRIKTSATAQEVTIQIADNGIGMPLEVQERLFEQGFTTKAVGKGTGLGMAIAYQIIVEKHGGTITCTSELGKGTEFTIRLSV